MKSAHWIAVACLASGRLWAQQEEKPFRSDFAVMALGEFTTGTSGQGDYSGPLHDFYSDHAFGLMASYRYHFNSHHGIEVDYSHAQFIQQYGLAGAGIGAGVVTHLHEATASYVFQYPYKRLTPYLSTGGGVALFHPTSSSTPLGPELSALPTVQVRPAFVYSGGVDLRITRHFSFRAAYRGLICSAPDFDVDNFRMFEVTHIAEPAAGFSYRW